MSARIQHITLFLYAAIFIGACGQTRRLGEGEYLLKKNKVNIEGECHLAKSDIENIIKQKKNRHFLGVFKLALWIHNIPNPDVVAAGMEERERKTDEKNAKRIAKGKKLKRYKSTFGEWLMYSAGEPPVILDSMLVEKSNEQMRLYLMKESYFNSTSSYKVKYLPKKKKAIVSYALIPGPPFTIKNLAFDIPDPNLKNILDNIDNGLIIHPGEKFSMEKMDKQRELMLRAFKNHGYYDVKKDEIYYRADSTIGNQQVSLTLGVRNLQIPYALNTDSLISTNHLRYQLDKILVNRSYNAYSESSLQKTQIDTLVFNNYTIVGNRIIRINPKIIGQNIRFSTNEFYNRDLMEATYKSLTALDIFNSVNIRYERKLDGNQPKLDCQILLTPAKKQQWGFETRGTNTSGFFGLGGSVNYKNRNIFRGAEVLGIRLSGSYEAQQLLTGSSSNAGETTASDGTVFNTVEVGPEVSLTIPRFLFPIKIDRVSKAARPFTIAKVSYSFQRRPDYTRNMTQASMSYRWSESKFKTWIVSPVDISLIKIFKSDVFQQRLDDLNDLYLNASYSDHLIPALKLSFIFNNQIFTKRSNSFFYRGNAETAGSLLRGLMALSGAEKDSLGSYELFGIRFAQYVRTDHDLRFYRVHKDNSSTVLRVFGGVGIPLANLNVLPFEKSFFAGGANGIRAWKAQTLGPGGYQSVLTTYDRIGELQLEANVEYRKKIFSVLEGALFLDIGNIWLLKPDPIRPNADFSISRFASEIAFGGGIGARLNFDFFIIRFDLATQLKDPALAKGERWVFQPKDDYNQRVSDYNEANNSQIKPYTARINFNLGIGYPF
jgi:outer membrane protein assembly factor BamA